MSRFLRFSSHVASLALLAGSVAACSGGAGTTATPVAALATPAPSPTSSMRAPSPSPSTRTSSSPSPAPSGPTVSFNETPLAADALADSVGLNENIVGTTNPATASDWQTLLALLHGLGVRHVRDGIINSNLYYDAAVKAILAASNAKLDGITACAPFANSTAPTSAAQIQAFNAAIGNGLESVEGPNEVDNARDANWVADTLAPGCLPSLPAAEPSLPLIAPSLADPYHNGASLGNISAYVTEGNIHRYFSGRNPGTAGWGGRVGCGIYGSLVWAICTARVNAGPKPVVITETGYNSHTEVDELTQAKYLSRLFLVDLQAGVAHSYIYCLRDSAAASAGNDGLIRFDDSLKPAYAAVASEIAYFSDPGSTVTRAPFAYAIRAPSTSMDHLLFRKGDGSYILALWNETQSWNPLDFQRIVVPAQTVAVTLPSAPTILSAVSMNDSGVLVTAAVTSSPQGITATVDDHVTFINFR